MIRAYKAYTITYTLILLNLLAYLPVAFYSGSLIDADNRVLAVFGALAGFFLVFRRRLGSQGKAVMQNFAIIIGLNLFIGLTIPAVDMSAHIVGLATGFIGGVMLAKHPQRLGYYLAITTLVLTGSIIYLRIWYASLA